MSSLSWIVFDETERQRARRIMALFEEKDARDELGLGPIRDSIADHLFPGTSTIQTRLRYMLFIPWIYTMVEKIEAPPGRLMEAAREHEVRLINALSASGEEEGVIGRYAGARLQRMPSWIYWNGLKSWGICLFPGSQDAYFASLPRLRALRCRDGMAESAAASEGLDRSTWNMGLPPAPKNLLEQTSFQLTGDEAGFLIDRMVNAQPDSLLTHLAKVRRHVYCDNVWAHPDFATFPAAIRRRVRHAEVFSAVMRGAALLYNLMLAERCGNKDWVARYRQELAEWKNYEFDRAAITHWSLDDFWRCIQHANHRVRDRTRLFVCRWCELADEKAGEFADLQTARDLVREREKSLKRSQSRFVNRAVLDKWGGRSGADRLNFRWREANSHIRDLANAD